MKQVPLRVMAALWVMAGIAACTNAFAQESGQPAGQPASTGWIPFGSWRLRAEDFNWYPTDKGNGAYTYISSRLRGGVQRQTSREDIVLELEMPALINIPEEASLAAPQGALGTGGNYRTADGNQVASLFFKRAYVRFKDQNTPGQWLQFGRFEFSDGGEVPSTDPTLSWLIENRISQRLIGPYLFSTVGRSLDGVEASSNTGNHNVTAMFSAPARGVYSLNGSDTLMHVQTGYLGATFPTADSRSASQGRLFATYYGDSREDLTKVDNRPASDLKTDHSPIAFTTLGGDYIRSAQVGPGRADALLWTAAQVGKWGDLTQGAYSYVAEMGYQPDGVPLHPWMRIGYAFDSGDGNPNNGVHGTFIPFLMSPHTYARDPFYTQANLRDAYFQTLFRPSKRTTARFDIHALSLADRNDLWYTGGGPYNDASFGFTGRNTNGASNLGTLFDLSIQQSFNKQFSMTFYVGYSAGGDAQASVYSGRDSTYGYLEANIKL